MAGADSAAKRYAAMLLACPWRPLAVLPSGTVDAAERTAALDLYSGITGAEPAAAADVEMLWHHEYGI